MTKNSDGSEWKASHQSLVSSSLGSELTLDVKSLHYLRGLGASCFRERL
jgi:hypothetical protein